MVGKKRYIFTHLVSPGQVRTVNWVATRIVLAPLQ